MEICNPLDHRVYLCCQGLLKSLEIVSKINRDIFVPGDKDRAFSKHSKASVIPKEQGTTKTDRALSTQRLHSHIPAATVPTDYRVEGQLRSRQHRLALGHYFHPASPHPTVPRVKDTVLVDERVPLGGQNEELGNHGRSGE